MRRRCIGALICLLAIAGCSNSGDATNPFSTAIPQSGSSVGTGSVTTEPDVDRNPDPLADPASLIEVDFADVTASEAGSGDELGGPVDYSTQRSVVAELEAILDAPLTGLEISIWPVTGTTESIMLIEATDAAANLTDDEETSESLFLALTDSEAIARANVTHLVMSYVAPNGDELTMVLALEDIRNAEATGANITDFAVVHVEGAP